MENLGVLYVHFKEYLSSVALEPKHRKSIIPNKAKETLKSKQIEMVSQNRRQGQLLNALLFEAFPYFDCFRILANPANYC